MGTMRDEAAHTNRAAIAGRGDQHHLGHGFFRNIAQIHQGANRQPYSLYPGL